MRRRTGVFRIVIVPILLVLGGLSADAKPYRPLVFVPGILGSILERDGKILWGEQGSLFGFSELLMPIDEKTKTTVKATGIVKSIAVLGAFKIHQYDGLYETLKEIGYTEGENLFSFYYDWRKSNFSSAEDLARFIESKQALNGEFDIVTHSMGGLVTRIYIHNQSSAIRVRTLLNLAVPFQGSLSVLQTLEKGWGKPANLLAGGLPKIREVVLSFPSMYELLPRYGTCCIYGVPGAGREFDILSEEFWQRYEGLPNTFKDADGQRFIAAQLRNARNLQAIVASPLPSVISERSIVGDLQDTVSRVYFDADSRASKVWQEERGDGTVVLMSAANGNIPRTDPAFVGHQIIFTDGYVKVLIQRAFDAAAGRFRNYVAPVPVIRRTGRPPVEIQGLNLEVEPVKQPGDEARITLTVRSRQLLMKGDIGISLTIGNGADAPKALAVTETTDDAGSHAATFNAVFLSPAEPGFYQVVAEIPGIGAYDDYFLVVPK
jgi:pimeloyl-ACP methyl ester carboxylesterase